MGINLRPNGVNYHINIDHNNCIVIDDAPNLLIKKDNRIKISYDIDLELHLRNSEVVGIPIIHHNLLNKGITCISHSFKKPIQGTQYKLYLTLLNDYDIEFDLNELKGNLEIMFISKRYCKALVDKDYDGLRSVPININII